MDQLFARLLEQHTPKVNEHVMKGLGVLYMKKAEAYIDQVFRSASKSFPAGLTYLGYERCTPEEEFNEITRVKNNKRTFDLAPSSLYLVKYKFEFEGQPIPDRYIYLPYVGDGAIFSLGGALFHITPVLSDKVISPGFDSIFVRLLRDKIIFKRCYHSFIVDGIRETSHVIWSQIYRKAKESKKIPTTTKALTSIAHYLFAKYGFTETFQRYAGFVPVVGENEINAENYPAEKWVICESSQVKPKTYLENFYNPSQIRLAIPKEKWNPAVKSLVLGFYYVIDHFPDRFKPSYLDVKSLWMKLLGHIVFTGAYPENVLYSNIEEHFVSLDDYVDTIIADKLRENNYNVNNFYDLLALIVSNFDNFVHDSDTSVLSMYGKSLEVLYYMLYDITSGIFKVNFRLGKVASKKPLTMNTVIEAFNKNMTIGAVYKLASGKIITESVSYTGDHLYPKITSKITEQESLPGATRGKSHRKVVGEHEHVDISMSEAGSLLFLSKSNPTPTQRVNPFVMLDLSTGTIVPNPKFKEIRERTQNLFVGQVRELSHEQLEYIHQEPDIDE